ncbi:hypothetical protein [Sphingomonas hankookensis]|uniref:hypothetical protein n=1 Tax=Sphingomonas hankookensis TaxID=563996 RepID=UPI003D302328
MKIKPNGRRCYTLHSTSEQLVESEAGAHPYIDLSVMDFRLAALASAPAEPVLNPTPLETMANSMAGGDPVDDMSLLLMRAWAEADPRSTVAQHPVSYVATFADMARAVIASAPAGDAFADAGKPIAPAGDGVEEAIERMRANPFMDDAAMLGTLQQDARMAHYARVALARPQSAVAHGGDGVENRFWLIVREPGMVPDRKGPFRQADTAKLLREFMAARPRAFIDHLTIDADGTPWVDHGPEVLQMTDGRSMSVGRKHNARVREAAEEALARPRAAVTIDADMLGEVMQDAWGEICDDAGSHPSDMKHGRGTVLHYRPDHWTTLIALRLSERLNSPRAAEAVDGAYGVHPNVVDHARAIILAAIAMATPSPDDSGYLTQLHDDVKAARPAQMDSWLAMDAVIAALNLAGPRAAVGEREA